MISIPSPSAPFGIEGARTVVAGSVGAGGMVWKSEFGATDPEVVLAGSEAPLPGFEESLTAQTLGVACERGNKSAQ